MKEAIVLAGGAGTRLRQSVPNLPKPMAPIGGKPFLEIVLASLGKKGFQRVILSLCYMADKVTEHFGSQFAGMGLVYVIEQTPLGTGGAARLALSRCQEDHVFVFNGDTFLNLEVADAENVWRAKREPVIIARETPDVGRYGFLKTQNGYVSDFVEKTATGPGLINAGCYIFPTDILDQFSPNQPFSLETDFLTRAVNEQRFCVFVSKGRFIDIGTPEDYARARKELTDMKN